MGAYRIGHRAGIGAAVDHFAAKGIIELEDE